MIEKTKRVRYGIDNIKRAVFLQVIIEHCITNLNKKKIGQPED